MTEEVAKQLTEYIDKKVLADAVCQTLIDEGETPTVENTKKLWLSFLENDLSECLKDAVERVDGL